MPELAALREDVGALTKAVAANNRLTRWRFRVLAVFAVILLGLVVWLSLVTESQRASCRSTNATRAQSAQLWNHFLDIAAPHPAPSVAPLVTDLRASIARTYAPKKCGSPWR